MKPADLSRVAGSGLIAIAAACGGHPTAPDGASSALTGTSGHSALETTFSIVNGWTREPVAGATVSADSVQLVSDEAGHFRLPKNGPCANIEVVAPNFLERRTCAVAEITLWPVADAIEREATRVAAFHHDELQPKWWSVPTKVTFAPQLEARADVVQTWRDAANEIRQMTLGRISFEFVPSIDDEGLIITPATSTPVCSIAPAWPIEIGGFCREYTRAYYVDNVNVLPGRLTDASVAVRALLSMVGAINPHPQAGLLNSSRPDAELSEFERKMLHMIGLRTVDVLWPDLDQIP